MLFMALCVFLVGQSIAQNAAPPLSGYKLFWSDDFPGNKLDLTKWDYRTDSKGLSTQKPENVIVANGTLKLLLKKEESGKMHYSGAGVISKQAFKFGYYEARMKVPPGSGWHTSFWMQKHDGKGDTSPTMALQELDVIENDSKDQKGYSCGVHKWKDGHMGLGAKKVLTPVLSADFHIYGCEFTPSNVNYFFDGKLVSSVNVTRAAKKSKDGITEILPFQLGDQNIWLTSIGYGDPRQMDESMLPTTAEYTYVRFYQKE